MSGTVGPSGRGRKVFRQASIERMSAPRDLDAAVRVVRAKDWFFFLALALVVGAALCWGFFGEVNSTVRGLGIIMKPGALFEVVSLGEGQVIEVLVRENEWIGQGQVVATVMRPELEQELAEEEKRLEQIQEEVALLRRTQQESADLGAAPLERQRRTLEEAIALGREHMAALTGRLGALEGLLGRGMITREALDREKNDYLKTLMDVTKAEDTLSALVFSRQKDLSGESHRLVEATQKLAPARERVASLRERLDLTSRIRSMRGGRVIEIYKDPGDMIREGQAVCNIEVSGDGREERGEDEPLVVAFIPPFQGKAMSPGMVVQVAPAVVRKEEYGVMIGEVLEASQYPASRPAMLRVLRHEELVERLARDGAPSLVKVALGKDPRSPSGFRWSSGLGPPMRIQSGALCDVEVVTASQRPIDLVAPLLNKTFLGVGADAPRAGR